MMCLALPLVILEANLWKIKLLRSNNLASVGRQSWLGYYSYWCSSSVIAHMYGLRAHWLRHVITWPPFSQLLQSYSKLKYFFQLTGFRAFCVDDCFQHVCFFWGGGCVFNPLLVLPSLPHVTCVLVCQGHALVALSHEVIFQFDGVMYFFYVCLMYRRSIKWLVCLAAKDFSIIRWTGIYLQRVKI